MIEIRRARLEEYEKVIDFIDLVFSKSHCPHDFETMYPNLYRKEPGYMEKFYLLFDDGDLKCAVLAEPRTLSVLGKKISIIGIGNVATHPRAMGKGYMTKLMTHIVEDIKASGVHLSVLGGRRLRYNHFGYEIAGNYFDLNVSPAETKALFPDFDASGWRFEKVTFEDKEELARLKAFYEELPWHYDYNDKYFYYRMEHEGASLYAVYAPDGSLAGFTGFKASDGSYGLLDLCVKDELREDAAMALAIQHNKTVSFASYPWQVKYLDKALDISGREFYRSGSGMWNVLSWKEPVEAILAYKNTYDDLLPGRLVIGVEPGVKIAVEVGESVSVEYTEEEADISFEGLRGVRAIFGPWPHTFFAKGLSGEKLALADSWFPLPAAKFGSEAV